MSQDWDQLRDREFPVSRKWAYFDHAAVSPLPRRSAESLREWAAGQEADGCVYWPMWRQRLEELRRLAARLIQADPSEIALVNSTTQGIGLVAEGFPWREGDNVVTAAEEYTSNIYPWMNLARRGVALRTVPTRPDGRIWVEDLAEAMDGRTRLLTISHVEFSSGFRNDLDALAQLCQERGVALFVDAIQGLGPLTIDVRRTGIDFLAADGHKWLLGPEGAGLFYVRGEWIDRLACLGVGWNSVTSSYNSPALDFRLKPTAERWEGGSYAMPGLQAFRASLELLEEIGAEEVSARILDRAEAVRERAQSAGWRIHGSSRPEDRSGIVVLEREGVDPEATARAFRERGIALSARRGRLRVSAHIYNNEDDLDRLSEALRGGS